MKTRLLFILTIAALLASSTSYGQQFSQVANKGSQHISNRVPTVKREGFRPNPSFSSTVGKGNNLLPETIKVDGAVAMPFSAKFDFATWGRPMHNIQMDPSNPNRLHACAMMANANTETDTAGEYPSRRVYYSFSNDGGKTWSDPKVISTIRLGYPDMLLYHRSNGDYVPVIAAHRSITENSEEVVTSLYVEQGAPGAGDFKEFIADRKSADGGSKDIIWPAIALSPDQSKLYVLGSVYRATTDVEPDNIEFGYYDLTEDGKTATWKGWIAQPGIDAIPAGWNSSGIQVIKVSESGKIGIMWKNADDQGPDLNLYYTESQDEGQTWPNPASIFTTSDPDNNGASLTSDLGFDFFFDGETPVAVWAIDQQLVGQNRFYPYTGELLYRRLSQDMQLPYILNGFGSLIFGGSTTIDPLYTPDYFTAPAAGSTVEPQGRPLISLPTIARTSDPNVWGVLYQTFADGDSSEVMDNVDLEPTSWWYGHIYAQFTKDNGETWSAPTRIAGNAPETPAEKKLDFHYPNVSTFNPMDANGINFQLMYLVDTFPGLMSLQRNGNPGWDVNTWFYQSYAFSGVKNTAHPAGFTLEQNYPNPFNPSTSISFNLAKRSDVVLTVTDVLGRVVATLVNETRNEGPQTVKFDASNLPSGVYNYTLKAGTESFTRQMVLSK